MSIIARQNTRNYIIFILIVILPMSDNVPMQDVASYNAWKYYTFPVYGSNGVRVQSFMSFSNVSCLFLTRLCQVRLIQNSTREFPGIASAYLRFNALPNYQQFDFMCLIRYSVSFESSLFIVSSSLLFFFLK